MVGELGFVIEQPVSIREQVYKRIRELISSGRIAPATRIVENKLAQQLGVSRTPVREALHVLEMEGFLDAIPRIGYQVKELLIDELDEICEIRKVNEVLAAQWALQKITPEEIAALEENLDAAETDVKHGSPEKFIPSDAEFHEILVRASRSRRLLEICHILRRHMFLYRIESMYNEESALHAIANHRRIVERIKERDAAGVEQAIHEHLDHVKNDIRQYAFLAKQKTSS
jgi:DNA-binding GntR family transcriptional regulator